MFSRHVTPRLEVRDLVSQHWPTQRLRGDRAIPCRQPCPSPSPTRLRCASPWRSPSRWGTGKVTPKTPKLIFTGSSVQIQSQSAEEPFISVPPFITRGRFQKHFVFIILLWKLLLIHIYYKQTLSLSEQKQWISRAIFLTLWKSKPLNILSCIKIQVICEQA